MPGNSSGLGEKAIQPFQPQIAPYPRSASDRPGNNIKSAADALAHSNCCQLTAVLGDPFFLPRRAQGKKQKFCARVIDTLNELEILNVGDAYQVNVDAAAPNGTIEIKLSEN